MDVALPSFLPSVLFCCEYEEEENKLSDAKLKCQSHFPLPPSIVAPAVVNRFLPCPKIYHHLADAVVGPKFKGVKTPLPHWNQWR